MPVWILIIGYLDSTKTWTEYESKDEAKEAFKNAVHDIQVCSARILNDREY